ncbi:MAG: SPFH domain-containing protein, partial [Bacteroidota bacterium]
LTNLKNWKHGFESPFKAEVYFINTRIFTDNKWGTPNPIMLRDQDFGIVRVRAFGNYAFRIGDPAKFLTEVVGTSGHFTTEKISNQLRGLIVTRFSDAIAESKIPVLDMAANLDELSAYVKKQMILDFDKYGVDIEEFLIQNISLPPEVEEAMDKRSQMGALGNLDQYTKFQTANAIEKSAEKGGSMGQAMGAGMGFAMANQFAQQQQTNQGGQSTPPPPPPMAQFHVYLNGQQMGPYGMPQLQQMVQSGQLTREVLVWKQGFANWTAAGQVAELSNLFGATPPPPPPM